MTWHITVSTNYRLRTLQILNIFEKFSFVDLTVKASTYLLRPKKFISEKSTF